MDSLAGARYQVKGIVQGVGFRPFVYALATRLGLRGWVRNTSAGVVVEVDGSKGAVDQFGQLLRSEAPPLAVIDAVTYEPIPAQGFTSFEIITSQAIASAFQPISADMCICPDCLRELRDPTDRRYHYPFINCTNCGPRFTIITDIPYDRPNTTMAGFDLCPACAREYTDPGDRRFHAQPVACPVCGPHTWLEAALPAGAGEINEPAVDAIPANIGRDDLDASAITQAQEMLQAGKILAIKGLGGFHLACDAANPSAVAELRRRKLRVDKPFAVMMADLETAAGHCIINPQEAELLQSRERPVVILQRRPESVIAAEVAPGQRTLGVMLPYTPLHYLLFEPSTEVKPPAVLVMTSGNLSEEPIATGNHEARQRLSALADAFLMHNRPIRTRCDDSVTRLLDCGDGQPSRQFSRRSRGYAPTPLPLAWEQPQILAVGAELKNTFCFSRDRYAFLSHHIGDLENYETLQSFEDGIGHFEKLFRLRPAALAHDLHPNYLSTRYALDRSEGEGLPLIGVQHHHAHIAACMADNRLPVETRVIGVAFDGTGYGEDGAIWGGEFLLAGYAAAADGSLGENGYVRLAHLDYQPLPGGDAGTRRPARIALAYLWQAGMDWPADLPVCQHLPAEERAVLRSQLERAINVPRTSSMGRLFDAVSALANVRQVVNYEAQAAIELEALADPDERGCYPFDITPPGSSREPLIIGLQPLLAALTADLLDGKPAALISARFHNGVAQMVVTVCNHFRLVTGINEVALSGGVWQNFTLLGKTIRLLRQAHFEVNIHRQVPANDGGLALGQAVLAGCKLASE